MKKYRLKTGDGVSRLVNGLGLKGSPREFFLSAEQADRLRQLPIVVFVDDEPEPEPEPEFEDE